MALAPIDFRPSGMMQEIPGMFDPRTGKTKYPQPEIFGGEIKPGIRDHLHRWDDPLDVFADPYIPSDDNKGIELFGGGNRMAGNFGDLKSWEKRILQDGLKVRKGHPSYDAEKLRLINQYPGFQALIPRDDELGDIIRQQDSDIFDEYRRIDGENRDLLEPSPIRKAGGFNFINSLMA